jgi:hypothetical protein
VAWPPPVASPSLSALALAPRRTWADLLINGYYMLAVGASGFVFIALQLLCGAAWSANIRRVPRALMRRCRPRLLMLRSSSDARRLRRDRGDASAAEDVAVPGAAVLLRTHGAVHRDLGLFAWTMRRTLAPPGSRRSGVHHRRLVAFRRRSRRLRALVLAGELRLVMTLAALEQRTIFAVYTFRGAAGGGVAAITLAVVLLVERGDLDGRGQREPPPRSGKLLFAFSTFWAYIWVSQYLLIWYGNLPDETSYYLVRTTGMWIVPFLLNVAVNWVVPFLVLLPRASKRNVRVLKWIAIVVLAGAMARSVRVGDAGDVRGPRAARARLCHCRGMHCGILPASRRARWRPRRSCR